MKMAIILVWLCTLVLGFWIFKKLRDWQDLPPGPWGLPVVGYLPFINKNYPHLTLTELSKQYGPIYGIGMGNLYAVVLSDHKLVREAFAKEVFAGRAPLYLTHGIMHGNGIICAEGKLWRDQRKCVTSWLKSYGMSKHSASRDKLEKRIDVGVQELLQNVQETFGSAVDLNKLLRHSVGNIVNEIIFGFKFPLDDKTWHWFMQIQEEGSHEMGVAGVVNFLPFVRFISPSIQKTIKVLVRGQAQTHRLYASMINRRRQMLGLKRPEGAEYLPHGNIFEEHPEGFIKCIKYSKHALNQEEHYFDPNILLPSYEECILDSFLKEQTRRYESQENSAKYMTDEQLHFLLADMFGAGLDTTIVTFAWFFLFMALYPDEQELVRKEILDTFPEESEIDSSKLPRLMAAICETQRIRSIVPVGIPHGCLQETFLGSYKIPKGAMVIPLQWAIHLDPNSWENPDEFKPARFLDIDGNLLKPQEFIPFQTGKRMCPGDELARMVSSSFAAGLFRRIRIRLASKPPTPKELQGISGITLAPPEAFYYCEPV